MAFAQKVDPSVLLSDNTNTENDIDFCDVVAHRLRVSIALVPNEVLTFSIVDESTPFPSSSLVDMLQFMKKKGTETLPNQCGGSKKNMTRCKRDWIIRQPSSSIPIRIHGDIRQQHS